jgi:hypothetical protein
MTNAFCQAVVLAVLAAMVKKGTRESGIVATAMIFLCAADIFPHFPAEIDSYLMLQLSKFFHVGLDGWSVSRVLSSFYI